ncbi:MULTISPECIES: Gp138 family membrane-puncturing spike protein [Achromobacter]|uniref:Gp138 family membrane-puncturing spike protein n=1 Tax=Achromobacter spanius TaxID=217203 RepID=A0ABY8H0F2_9BURK|nr:MULTISPECIES: Gp138 family membrane-puncturing spike protein [Achromobacter]WAI85844.1 Gp138 family membrane-puncturing spike protein [Achromobacter spanius]WEX95925.1 Gp138 family membrane-puncturing spike protein [Achromobacter sp. SS2-2022]WFP10355.1 Gp138 family membrane-puncturing spike protein [Achromobacter spanius]
MNNAVTLMRRLIATELADVYTTLPGEVVAYDGTFVTARPALAKRLANGDVLPPPQVVRVPVCWPVGDVNGAQALISVPLAPGDAIKLSFSARALENWLAGDNGPPDDPRQFDLSDAFASPLLRPGTIAADTQNVSIQYGPGTLKLSPTGDLTFHVKTWTVQAEQATFNTPVTINGPLTYTQGMSGEGGQGGASMRIRGGVAYEGGAITHNGKSIGDTHRHAYAGGTTEGPI